MKKLLLASRSEKTTRKNYYIFISTLCGWLIGLGSCHMINAKHHQEQSVEKQITGVLTTTKKETTENETIEEKTGSCFFSNRTLCINRSSNRAK
ncbi:MAG: hypothetical protein ACLSYA_02285 [Enterococcus durans]